VYISTLPYLLFHVTIELANPEFIYMSPLKISSYPSKMLYAMAIRDVALETKVSVACGYGFDMHPRVFKCHAGVQLLDIK